jgi:hypothetical protein
VSHAMRGSRGLIDQACPNLGVYIYVVVLRAHVPFSLSLFSDPPLAR